MPVGTIRGRVELDAPALRVMRDLERQGIRTEAQMKSLGRAIDEVSGPGDQADIDRLTRKVRDLGTQTSATQREVSRGFRNMRRDVVRDVRYMKAEITELEVKIDRLSRKRATPRVDVDGIAEALAQVELLDSRLNALGRNRSTPRVALGGGFGSGFGGGGAGGPSAVARAGGGGLSLGTAALGAGAALALPAAQALTGATVALAGSAGAALLGAGAAGIAGGAGLLTGVGGILAVAKPMRAEIDNAYRAQQRFTLAVKEFGRNSRQAAVAKRNLDQAMAAAPRGTRQVLEEFAALRTTWATVSRPGQDSLMRLGIGTLRDVRGFARGAGGAAANRVAGATSREGLRFARFLTGPTGGRLAGQGAGIFDENLGNLRLATQYGIEWFTNVTQAARPFFREATAFIQRWMGGWATNTRDIESTRLKISGMIDQLKTWLRLTGATGRLLKDLMSAGAPSGQSLVERLTAQLDKWDMWVRRNPAQIADFFRRSETSVIGLARALAGISHVLSQISTVLQPVLDRFTSLVSLASMLGLFAPGVGTLAFGAAKGAGARLGLGGGGGGGMGLLPLGMGGRGAGGAAAAAAEGPGLGSRFLGGAAVGIGALGSVWTNWRTNAALRGTALAGGTLAERDAARAALGVRTAQGLTLSGAFTNSTYNLARSFGYGRGSSVIAQLGALRGIGSGSALMAGIGGAARAYLPIAALLGGLDAYGFQGNLGQKAQAGLSTVTLGAISRPLTGAQKSDKMNQAIQDMLTQAGGSGGVRGLRRQIAALRFAVGTRGEGTFGSDQPGGALGLFGAGDAGFSASDIKRGTAQLRQELDARVKMYRDYIRQRNAALDDRSRGQAARFFNEFQQGFTNRQAREGTVPAFSRTIAGTIQQIGQMRTAGGRALAEMTLSWARAQERANPALRRQYDELVSYVEKKFKGLRGGVTVVNGQILDGSRQQWGQIADAIASQARRGVDETSAEFQQLQAIAIGELVYMGFTRAQAGQIFRAERAGGRTRNIAQQVVSRAQQGIAGPTRGEGQVFGTARRNATGGRLDGKGLQDTVALANGSLGAPGELVVNRHQEREADRFLSRFGLSLDTIVRRIRRRHDTPPAPEGGIMAGFARGGRLRYAIGGRLGAMVQEANQIDSRHFPYLWGGGHSGFNGPYDCSGAVSAVLHAGGYLNSPLVSGNLMNWGLPGPGLVTIFANPSHTYMRLGNRYFGTSQSNPGGGAGWFAGSARPGFAVRHVPNLNGAVPDWLLNGGMPGNLHLSARRSALGGAPGILSSAAMAGMAASVQDILNARINAPGFLGSFARGGHFITRPGRAGLFMAGEGPNREEVTVRPYAPRRRPAHVSLAARAALGGGVSVSVSMGHVTVRSEADVEKVATRVGRKLLAALRGEPDEELVAP